MKNAILKKLILNLFRMRWQCLLHSMYRLKVCVQKGPRSTKRRSFEERAFTGCDDFCVVHTTRVFVVEVPFLAVSFLEGLLEHTLKGEYSDIRFFK